MIASLDPYPPTGGLVMRRLVSRTSLMLLLPGLPHPMIDGPYLGGSGAPWQISGVAGLTCLQTAVAGEQDAGAGEEEQKVQKV
jgi:hypothetical protein